MKVEQKLWQPNSGWKSLGSTHKTDANLVIYFGNKDSLEQGKFAHDLMQQYPNAHVVGCSTGGEISGPDVFDNSVTALAIQFDSTKVRVSQQSIDKGSFDAGKALAEDLQGPDLAGVFVLSDGLNVNGSLLVDGLTSVLGKDVPITGGLAGDGANFAHTIVGCNAEPESNKVIGVGFYGQKCKIGHGSMGGWMSFGAERLITKSKDNVLFELDGKPALSLYKSYLGDEAQNLPGSGLLYPLSIRSTSTRGGEIVRTILAVDETTQSLTFAGDMPQGSIARLMRGSMGNLIDGAENAARQALIQTDENQVAILVSCIGRKLLMGQRVEDEVEAVQGTLGHNIPQIGFYSYGEISPHDETGLCGLHNQTMTITTLTEEK